jgi:hypothetical protein
MSDAPKEDDPHLTEARKEADSILAAVEHAPKSPSWQQLGGEEQSAIAAARDRLIVAKQEDETTAIRDAIHVLDLATRRFAELMIETAVQAAIRGGN